MKFKFIYFKVRATHQIERGYRAEQNNTTGTKVNPRSY